MEFTMKINMDNAIFDNIPELVLADMLTHVGRRIERGETFGNIHEPNGNKIGNFEIETS